MNDLDLAEKTLGAWMPAICQNVRNVEGAQFVSRQLVYDKYPGNTGRSTVRGQANCPTKWKKGHPCPEVNQPGVISSNAGPSRPGPIGLANPLKSQDSLEIEPPPGQTESGLQYSCDEYPAKT